MYQASDGSVHFSAESSSINASTSSSNTNGKSHGLGFTVAKYSDPLPEDMTTANYYGLKSMRVSINTRCNRLMDLFEHHIGTPRMHTDLYRTSVGEFTDLQNKSVKVITELINRNPNTTVLTNTRAHRVVARLLQS